MADTEGGRGKKRSIDQQGDTCSTAKEHAEIVFSLQDRIQLIKNVREYAPKTKKHSYKGCIAKIDWSKVAFGEFPSEACQIEWDVIQNEIIKYRTFEEVTADALQIVQNRFSHRKLVHPGLPKQALTPLFMFYSEKAKKFKKKHPEMPQYEISRSLALKFKELPEHKKAKYNQKYGDQRLMFQRVLATFLVEHPKYKKDSRHGGGGPKPPKLLNPYQLWANKRFEALQREDKEVTRVQLDDKLGEEWKTTPDKKRVKWINKALEEQIKYTKEIQEYVEQNPNFKVPEIKKPLLTEKELRLKEGLDGKPFKPPVNAYNLFCSEMLKQMGHMGSNTRAKMMEWSALWSNTDAKKKQEYKDRVEKLKVMYKSDLEKYIEGLPEEEREKYGPELEAIERQNKRTPKATNSLTKDRDRYDELKKAGLGKYSREVTKKKRVKRKKMAESDTDEDSDDEEDSDEESDEDSSSASSGSESEPNSSNAASGSDDDVDVDDEEASNSGQSTSASSSSGSSSSEEEEEEAEVDVKVKGGKGKQQKGKEKMTIKQESKENGEKEDSGTSSESESSSSEASSEEESD